MSETTEIYLCRAGQKLNEGRVVYSDNITTKALAEKDAVIRCGKDNTLAKIGYYSVSEDGNFKAIYTHTNPNAIGMNDAPPPKKVQLKKKKKKPTKRSLWQRLFGK